MQKKTEKTTREKETIFRKCSVIYALLGIIFFFVLLMMLLCLTPDLRAVGGSAIQFLFLVEVMIAIFVFEEYMNILIVGKDGIRIESGILVKNKKDIPYNQINSINIHSVFGFGTLEIMTGNDVIIRYKFLDKYEEAEKIIKEHIHKK